MGSKGPSNQQGVTLHSFLEGIQMRLTDKYRPQQRVMLPPDYTSRYQADIEAILDFDYYFKLEEQVLATYSQTEEKIDKTKSSLPTTVPVEEVLPPILVYSSSSSKTETETDGERTKSKSLPPPRPPPPLPTATKEVAGISMNPFSASVSYRPLEPQKAQRPETNSEISQNPNRGFRVEDFEPNSANPFDNLELKSLNDMEQLQQVLAKDKESTK